MTAPTQSPILDVIDSLRSDIRGRVIHPEDHDYAELAPPFNLAGDFSPLAVVEALDAVDVATTLRLAARAGVEVSVRATGHGAVPCIDRAPTLLLRTDRLDELSISGRVARVGAGVRWQAVLDAAGELGLAAPAGSAPHVGVVGYLTGGGVSPIGRTTGFASDHVRAFEVVTGDGLVRRATPDENPGLFWALRGGKGSLGIVTSVEIELLELPTIFGGCVFLDATTDADVIEDWARWCVDLPVEATTSIAVMRLPEMPGVPAPIAGRCTVSVRFAWTGDAAAGRALLARLLGGRTPLLGGHDVMPFAAMGAIHADPVDPMPVATSAALLSRLDEAAVRTLIDHVGPDAPCPQIMVEVRHLGGVLAEAPSTPSALCHRDGSYLLHTVGLAVPPMIDAVTAHAAELKAAMGPAVLPGILPTFAPWDSANAVTEQYDIATLDRLASLAAAYDPHGVIADGNLVQAAAALVR